MVARQDEGVGEELDDLLVEVGAVPRAEDADLARALALDLPEFAPEKGTARTSERASERGTPPDRARRATAPGAGRTHNMSSIPMSLLSLSWGAPTSVDFSKVTTRESPSSGARSRARSATGPAPRPSAAPGASSPRRRSADGPATSPSAHAGAASRRVACGNAPDRRKGDSHRLPTRTGGFEDRDASASAVRKRTPMLSLENPEGHWKCPARLAPA